VEKAQRLAQLGKLVADIAHEVNSPLMVISGRAQLALMNGTLDQELRRNLETITGQAQRASDIIQRLLKFSRPAKGIAADTALSPLVEETVLLVEHQFSLSQVTIHRDYAPGLPQVTVDGKQMQEVFLNILNNARDAMPGGGSIEISTRRDRGAVVVEFRDSGYGIPPEVMARLFEPFYTTKEKGTGLGLAVSYGIVQAQGGDFKLSSAPGSGTAAIITLPAKEA